MVCHAVHTAPWSLISTSQRAHLTTGAASAKSVRSLLVSAMPEEKEISARPEATFATKLQALLLFHNCVNEETLKSAHAGPQNWNETLRPASRCPEGMKRMSQLRFSIRFDLRSVLPGGWSGPPPFELACGPSFYFHGDFINGWLPDAAENMLLANSERDFLGVDGAVSSWNDGPVYGYGNAVDADPENGTSDYAESKAIVEANAAHAAAKRNA